jgi:hypothetical protein
MSNLRDAAVPHGLERFREEYRIVNVNACGMGSCDPASVATYPTGRRGHEARTWQAYAVKAVFWPIGAMGETLSMPNAVSTTQATLDEGSGGCYVYNHLGDATSISSSLCLRPELLGPGTGQLG